MLNNQDFTHDRTKYLGGSDIGPILGLSKYRSPMDVWLEKTGKVNSTIDNLPIRFGNFAEAFVASEYAKATHCQLEHPSQGITHAQFSYLQGHIDRLVLAHEAEPQTLPHILECKTANPFTRNQWGEAGSDEVPLSYLAQCHWYLALSQLQRCDLAVLFGNTEFRIYHILRDEQLENRLIENAVSFWEKHVLTDSPPAAQCIADYQTLFPSERAGKSVPANEHTAQLITQFHHLHSEIEQKEAQCERIKETIMAQMQDAEKLTYQEQLLATWKQPKPSVRFDQKRFCSEHPQLASQYQQQVQSSRRLVIKALPHSEK